MVIFCGAAVQALFWQCARHGCGCSSTRDSIQENKLLYSLWRSAALKSTGLATQRSTVKPASQAAGSTSSATRATPVSSELAPSKRAAASGAAPAPPALQLVRMALQVHPARLITSVEGLAAGVQVAHRGSASASATRASAPSGRWRRLQQATRHLRCLERLHQERLHVAVCWAPRQPIQLLELTETATTAATRMRPCSSAWTILFR